MTKTRLNRFISLLLVFSLLIPNSYSQDAGPEGGLTGSESESSAGENGPDEKENSDDDDSDWAKELEEGSKSVPLSGNDGKLAPGEDPVERHKRDQKIDGRSNHQYEQANGNPISVGRIIPPDRGGNENVDREGQDARDPTDASGSNLSEEGKQHERKYNEILGEPEASTEQSSPGNTSGGIRGASGIDLGGHESQERPDSSIRGISSSGKSSRNDPSRAIQTYDELIQRGYAALRKIKNKRQSQSDKLKKSREILASYQAQSIYPEVNTIYENNQDIVSASTLDRLKSQIQNTGPPTLRTLSPRDAKTSQNNAYRQNLVNREFQQIFPNLRENSVHNTFKIKTLIRNSRILNRAISDSAFSDMVSIFEDLIQSLSEILGLGNLPPLGLELIDSVERFYQEDLDRIGNYISRELTKIESFQYDLGQESISRAIEYLEEALEKLRNQQDYLEAAQNIIEAKAILQRGRGITESVGPDDLIPWSAAYRGPVVLARGLSKYGSKETLVNLTRPKKNTVRNMISRAQREGLAEINSENFSKIRIARNITLSGGRSGQKVKTLIGPPNSAIKGNGNRVFITDKNGHVILDITTKRTKTVVPGVGLGPKRLPTEQEIKILGLVLE